MDGNVSTDGDIRGCGADDGSAVLAIINAAAQAYRGVIPPDRWRDPYMERGHLAAEIADGVTFSGFFARATLVGVMGIQARGSVDLIRHAYVLPEWQGRGVGSRLLDHLCRSQDRPVLVGTWAAAHWAIRFYEQHGFAPVPPGNAARLLRAYWNVPERQVATSIVLASPPTIDVPRLVAERFHAPGGDGILE